MARCQLYDSGGQALPHDMRPAGETQTGSAIDATDEDSAGTMMLPPTGIAGLLNPWVGTMRANASRVMPLLSWSDLAGILASAKIALSVHRFACSTHCRPEDGSGSG